MRRVTYSMGVSLDGYVIGPDGAFDWTASDEELFRFVTDEIREVGAHLMGPTLAAEAAEAGLIDEYRARVHPVPAGGGTPYFPRHERRVDLELVETRTFGSGVVFLRHRVSREREGSRP